MTPMTLAERMTEARARQARRGRLRWLLDDFCRRNLMNALRPGELIDLADDVRVFAGAADAPAPQEADLREMQARTVDGLRALFAFQPWPLGTLEMEIHVSDDPRDLSRKAPKRLVDKGVVLRLWLPLALKVRQGQGTLTERFNVAAAQEAMAAPTHIGRCVRCEEFFYRVRRREFCSTACKQQAMDTAKARRAAEASGVYVERLPGHQPFEGLEPSAPKKRRRPKKDRVMRRRR